ncbi:MAG: hypothetical protein CMC08_09310, partial [Flavobacteriaceae bacterium]|nr:hypothetical protein [Flavobacteriaceae bacterium]
MKVLQLIDSLAPGGAERMAVNLANASAWEGVESHLMATRRGGKLEQAVISSVSVVILEKQSTLDLSALARAVQYIRKHRITVLHAHTTSYFFATLLKIRNPKLHLIWHEHHGYREHMSVWNNKT